MVKVKVPATSANLGPGFDCVGMALNLFNTIEVSSECFDGLVIEVTGEGSGDIPLDETNLVYQSMKKVFDLVDFSYKGLHIKLHNDIPLTRGLGSSAACIVGGLLSANYISGQKLSTKQIIDLAAKMDGHPDNVLPALVGSMTVACMDSDKVYYVRVDPPINVRFAVLVPDFELETSKARKAIPESIPTEDAVFNIGRAALMIASFLTGNVENLMIATQDKLHQPYRKSLIPGFQGILDACKQNGAKGAFLSGAGPTIIAILSDGNETFVSDINSYLDNLNTKWSVKILDICRNGAEVEKKQEVLK